MLPLAVVIVLFAGASCRLDAGLRYTCQPDGSCKRCAKFLDQCPEDTPRFESESKCVGMCADEDEQYSCDSASKRCQPCSLRENTCPPDANLIIRTSQDCTSICAKPKRYFCDPNVQQCKKCTLVEGTCPPFTDLYIRAKSCIQNTPCNAEAPSRNTREVPDVKLLVDDGLEWYCDVNQEQCLPCLANPLACETAPLAHANIHSSFIQCLSSCQKSNPKLPKRALVMFNHSEGGAFVIDQLTKNFIVISGAAKGLKPNTQYKIGFGPKAPKGSCEAPLPQELFLEAKKTDASGILYLQKGDTVFTVDILADRPMFLAQGPEGKEEIEACAVVEQI